MFKKKRGIYTAYFFVDAVIIIITFILPYFLRYRTRLDFENMVFPYLREYGVIYLLWVGLIIAFFKARGLYTTDRNLSIFSEILKVSSALIIPSVIIAGVIFFLQFKEYSRIVFIGNFSLLLVGFSLWRVIKRLIVRDMVKKGYYNVNVLIVGAGKIGTAVAQEIGKHPFLGLQIKGFLDDNKTGAIEGRPVLGKLSDFIKVCKKNFIDEVFITIPSERQQISKIIQGSKKLHLGLRIVPEKFEEHLMEVSIGHMGVIPVLTYKERTIHKTELFLKRCFDFILALLFTIILSPLFLIIAIAIKLESRGPVMYVQPRIGRKGTQFMMYKFRSMVQNADALLKTLEERNEVRGGVIFKIKDDPRITKVGRFLRRYSLDELPQLFNVLFGDMSLVGPRPFMPHEVAGHSLDHLSRLQVRPGITGLSQIHGRSDLSFYRWVRWDIWYVENWSFRLDLEILWRTIGAVIEGKGAY